MKSRSWEEASEEALDYLTLVRATWNYGIGSPSFFPGPSIGKIEAGNWIVPGGIFTLHEPGGRTATGTFWFDLDPSPPRARRLNLDHWKDIRQTEKLVRRAIQTLTYGYEFQRILCRYCRALDQRDPTNAFLRLWAVLETLAGIGAFGDGDVVKRLLFFSGKESIELDRALLVHAKESRNEFVHQDSEASESDRLVYVAGHYAAKLIGFHIFHGRSFGTLKEAGAFLDLPTDSQELERRATKIKKAMELREKLGS